MQCGIFTMIYSVALYKLLFVFVCITYRNVVFMEGTHRWCSGALSVLYFVTLYIFIFGVKCVIVSNDVFMEETDSVQSYNDVLREGVYIFICC